MKRLLLTLLTTFLISCSPSSRVIPSTIQITMKGGACSSFYVRPNQLLTAKHCVGEDMKANGEPVIIEKTDDFYDLALVFTPTEGRPLVISPFAPEQGQHLTAIGYALGWSRPISLDVKVLLDGQSIGVEASPGLIVQGEYVGGMSGGPVVDSNGDVVAIVQSTRQGISYGVPSVILRAFLYGVD